MVSDVTGMLLSTDPLPMGSVSVEELLRQLREVPRYRRELAEILASDPEVRLALLQGLLREVATRQDLERHRVELKAEIVTSIRAELVAYIDSRISDVGKRLDDVNRRIDDLSRRVDDLSALVRTSLIAIVVTLVSTVLVPLLLRVLH